MYAKKEQNEIVKLGMVGLRFGSWAGFVLSEIFTLGFAIYLSLDTANSIYQTKLPNAPLLILIGQVIGVMPGTLIGNINGFITAVLFVKLRTIISRRNAPWISLLISLLIALIPFILVRNLPSWVIIPGTLYLLAALWLGSRLYTKLKELEGTNQAADDITGKPPATI